MDAEHTGHARIDRGTNGGEPLPDDLQVVADQGRHETRGSEAPVGTTDRSDRVQRWLGIEQHAASAIDLCVDEPRQQDASAEVPPLGAPADRVIAVDDAGDAARVEQHRPILQNAVISEHAAVDESDRHQTVSVTLERCGGRSGSRPRANASAFASR